MPLRPCLDCGALVEGTRCASCRSDRNRTRDQARGTRQQRGYGAEHEAERRRWAPVVASGMAKCAEPLCLEASRSIAAGADWHLAHDRDHPGRYRGPAHPRCNEAEAGRYAAALRKSSVAPP